MPGPGLSLTAALFLELIGAQDEPDFFWSGVLEHVNAYREEDGRRGIARRALRSYLLSQEGESDWQVLGQDIFHSVQVDALTVEQPFVIPDVFLQHVEEMTPVSVELPFEVLLDAYEDEDVNGAALLRLIEAQDFGDRLWQHAANWELLVETLDDELGVEGALDDFPTVAAADWPRFLASLPDDEVSYVSAILLELVRLECERRGVQPRIPEDLAEIFGPDDDERRWLAFSERVGHDLGWTICEDDAPWTLHAVDGADGSQVPMPTTIRVAQACQQFIGALTLAWDCARRVDSPVHAVLSDARRLAMLAADPSRLDPAALPPGVDWQPDVAQLIQLFAAAFAPFEWGTDRLLRLVAVAVADVFGGTDSWDDKMFGAEDEAVIDAVSLMLATSTNRYFEALVSIEA